MLPLRVTILQNALAWEKPADNCTSFEEMIDGIDQETDLILLPETFTTGFSMIANQLAEPMEGPSVQWMRKMANKHQVAVAGSLIIEDQGRYYNRFIWMPPDGDVQWYDKRHLFRFAGEDEYFSNGNNRLIIEYKGWRIRPLVCYDLRFPVWSRNQGDCDCLIYVANWPEVRRDVWTTLLKARAMENQVYVVGVNRIGSDGNDITYAGDSAVYDPKGALMTSLPPYEQGLETVALSMEALEDFRKKFPLAKDADSFTIN